ncbi:MAG: hypothetical protein VB067_12295, partial [Christensenellaceae bacterium]|nr:hypothetical protein [Christensenellaceae bacterium]
ALAHGLRGPGQLLAQFLKKRHTLTPPFQAMRARRASMPTTHGLVALVCTSLRKKASISEKVT